MNTCLSGLWDVLLEKCYDKRVKSNDRNRELNQIIDRFYFDGKMDRPLHIKYFQGELLKEGSTLQSAARVADQETECCGLCAVCRKCATEFYHILQDGKSVRAVPLELKDYFADKSQFYYYMAASQTVKLYRRINNTLICLKGFSSTTPAIYSATFSEACSGGGFYLNVDGFGVVIDPGIDFVNLMHSHGIFIDDIKAVIVTHDHLDHNADVRAISALQYDLNRYYASKTKFYKKFFGNARGKKHSICWWLDEGTYELHKEIIPECVFLSKCNRWTKLNDKISFCTIETKHMKNGKSYGVKFKIRLDDQETIIGYTSDTKFFPELKDFMKDVNIIIFNISDIYEKDVRGIRQKNTHLGYGGSINLLEGERQSYELAIASEFCCSNGDYRMRVTRQLNTHIQREKKMRIIPGEVGLKVDLRSRGIYCSRCKCIVPAESISVVAAEREFGAIQYVCEKCQCVQKTEI